MNSDFFNHIEQTLQDIDAAGLYKHERIITSQQTSNIQVQSGSEQQEVINFCANNYLGLANSAELIEAGKAALDHYGYGMASVRFICGTQDVHRHLENAISRFLGSEETILYAACFDANAGVFEPLLGPEDAIISDALNHASIIDGIRLCKAKRFRYTNNNMADLETQLQAADAAGARYKMIATDGVFSMDGTIANLQGICDLADKYHALVMVDDCHATGFLGANGKGSPEFCGVEGRIDILTGTLGKALGGASGGYISSHKPIIDLLRQRSRPYLFSNTLAPVIAATSLKALELIAQGHDLRQRLQANAQQFRSGMTQAGFTLLPGEHPIIPVMLGDAKVAQQMAAQLLEESIYVIGFFYPVVPEGKARIRTQMSAAHTPEQIDTAITAFTKVGKNLGIIKS